MCVHDHQFVAVSNIVGEFEVNGVLGLAPVPGNVSFVQNLFNQGKIENPYVGLNFEYPEDVDQQSRVNFGWYDYSQAKGGKDGLLWYPNVGIDAWALLVKDFSYGQIDL